MKYVVFKHMRGLGWWKGTIYHSGNSLGEAKKAASEIFSIEDGEQLTLVTVIES